MYKLEKLSIADLKAVFDYANDRLKFYQEITPEQASSMSTHQTELIAKDFEYYLDVSTKLEAVLDGKIKALEL